MSAFTDVWALAPGATPAARAKTRVARGLLRISCGLSDGVWVDARRGTAPLADERLEGKRYETTGVALRRALNVRCACVKKKRLAGAGEVF
jgi:hypothetical protein